MRLVIEVTDGERDALRGIQAKHGTTYSALFRALLRLAVDGTIPDAKLKSALGERPLISVTFDGTKPSKDARVGKVPFTPMTDGESTYLKNHMGMTLGELRDSGIKTFGRNDPETQPIMLYSPDGKALKRKTKKAKL